MIPAPAQLDEMTLDTFMQSYEQDGPFEYTDGERMALMPGAAEHAELIKFLNHLLSTYKQQTGRVQVYMETAYVLLYQSNWVTGARVPDLMLYEAARVSAYKAADPDWGMKPFVLVPDLCIEVISPRDVYAQVDAKVSRYLSDGVRFVWVANPRLPGVQAHTSAGSQRLTERDILECPALLPGFSLPVRDLFPGA